MQINKYVGAVRQFIKISNIKTYLRTISMYETRPKINIPDGTVVMATHSFNSYNTHICKRWCSSIPEVDSNTFERVCEETLDSLCEYFEELVEDSPHLRHADVEYSSGVLSVNFGELFGTYVINRQSPNRQIWLSSPTSGPKRYDFLIDKQFWIYKHDSCSLHQLLQEEIALIVKRNVDFSKCSYSFINKL